MRIRGTYRAVCVALSLVAFAALPAAAGDEDRKDEKKEGGRGDARPRAKKGDSEKLSTEQFAQFDRNNDGTLRGAEIPNGWLDRFDRDGDGIVGRSEFVEINSRPEKLRRLHPMRDARARAADALASFDKNKDGAVQRDEYPGTAEVFRDADRSRNGALEPSELRAMADDEIDGIRKKMRSPNRYEFLVIFDIDKDQKVGGDEYDGPPGVFRKHDTDGDGVVTYDELFPERMKNARNSPAGPKPEQISAIQALDKDDDGRVARAEFAGSDAAWRRLDLNGDGFITSADGR